MQIQEVGTGSGGHWQGDWHALYTRHQHEKSVAQNLSNLGHAVFLPMVPTTHQWRDRRKQLWLPLFPCYVFIQRKSNNRFSLPGLPGVVNVVGWAGHAAVIPQRHIDAIRQMLESRLQVEPHPFLQTGDRVRVEVGPLRGVEGILAYRKNAPRLVVSIEILGRSAAVEIDMRGVSRIPQSSAASAG